MEKVDRAIRVQKGPFLRAILSYSNEICKIQSLTNCFKKKLWFKKVTEMQKFCLNQKTPSIPAIFPRPSKHKCEQTSRLERVMFVLRYSEREINSTHQRGEKVFPFFLKQT